MKRFATIGMLCMCLVAQGSSVQAVDDSSPLAEKAAFFQQDLLEKHWLDGLYISIVPSAPAGTKLQHSVDEPGNVIHAGVWTGRYLAGVGYQYAVTKDPAVRQHGDQILHALRKLQEVTGKPGLLARGYVKGHGPVVDWERDGRDSAEWHQGQGEYADYRWYGDVSVDNLNAVLYGYAVYFDLAADERQKGFIAEDVKRLMTHLLQNHCRIVDVDGEVTRWGHVGIDPDPARDEYYLKRFSADGRGSGVASIDRLPLRASLMLLPDLLIAHHITGEKAYLDMYGRVVARFNGNPAAGRLPRSLAPERLPLTNHSSEGQAYEALYNLIRYETNPKLLPVYRRWVSDLWERNWMEGNPLFTYMTLALLPEYRAPRQPGAARAAPSEVPHAAEGLKQANTTLALFPVDRVLRPVMNSRRKDIKMLPTEASSGRRLSTTPLPINQRPHDNEYEWKGNPYQLDGWLKPAVTAMQFACDDPHVAWFADSGGRVFLTLDRGGSWRNMSPALRGAAVRKLLVSRTRTFVLWAETNQGVLLSRDGGMSWREVPADKVPKFAASDFTKWQGPSAQLQVRIDEKQQLLRSADGGKTAVVAMAGWRIPIARSVFTTPLGIIAGGPGGYYRSNDGQKWEEFTLWREDETGAADFLHAYWMGRYYGFLPE